MIDNVTFPNTTAYQWVPLYNQAVGVINSLLENDTVSDGTITIDNPNAWNNNITVNVSSGMIAGDAGLVSNLNSISIKSVKDKNLQNNSIILISNSSTLMITGSANLGNIITITQNTYTSMTDNTNNVMASIAAVNNVYNYLVGIYNNINNVTANTIIITSLFNTINSAQTFAISTFNVANTINASSNAYISGINNLYIESNSMYFTANTLVILSDIFNTANSVNVAVANIGNQIYSTLYPDLYPNGASGIVTTNVINTLISTANTITNSNSVIYNQISAFGRIFHSINYSSGYNNEFVPGKNISTYTWDSTISTMNVIFTNALSSNNYVVFTGIGYYPSGNINGSSSNNQGYVTLVTHKRPQYFHIKVVDFSGNFITLANTPIDFIVFGPYR